MQTIHKRAKHVPQAGFTLIEILIVIGIIAILAAIVLVAVNPAKQFKDANDAQRASNVNAILNAVGQYMVDNKGSVPGGIPTGAIADADPIASGSGNADICDDLVPAYLAALPADPEETDQSINESDCDGTYDTGYKIVKDSDDRVTIISDQGTDDITVTR